jgi:hypothetical protein
MMKKRTLALAATLIAVASAGCNNFLTGDKLSNNPNVPTGANADQLFIGVEVGTMGTWESFPMNLLPVWAQQISGVARQGLQWSQYAAATDNLTSDALFNSFFGPGGLADIRRVVSLATAEGNMKLVGEAKVFEALYEGTAADIWGDVPYDSAGTAFPKYDSQAAVYAHVQATLDTAIADLSGAGAGATNDFYFGNDVAKWIATVHTLKARFYMHTAEKSDLTYDAAILQNVLTETASGIADAGSSFETKHTTNQGEQNLFFWYVTGQRQGDMGPSQLHINLAAQLHDPDVLAADYTKNVDGQYLGAPAGGSAPNKISLFNIGPTTSQVLASYAENKLLSAEAHYRLNNAALALADYNAEHAAFGQGPATVLGGTNGLLISILEEKYVRDFLDPNVWFDYLRTCVPNLPLPIDNQLNYIPARMPYGYTESISNPNIPADAKSNPNWPKHPTDPAGNVCIGQAQRTDASS